MSAPVERPGERTASEPTASPAHSIATHLRATAIFLVLTIIFAGFVYPVVVTGIADVINPSGAAGSLVRDPNGTVIGSSLVAQNTSAPYLFWERPSLSDYNTTLGAQTPPGPSDPALGQLLNETINYTEQSWNFSANHTLPYWFITPSASSIDPDLVPEAVLIQIPRVSAHTNLSVEFLLHFVNKHIINPPIPWVGVAYVNVLELDVALLPLIGK